MRSIPYSSIPQDHIVLFCILFGFFLHLCLAERPWHECPSYLDSFPENLSELSSWKTFEFNHSSPLSVSSWGPDRLDLFVTGTDRQVWHRSFDTSSQWSEWGTLGGQLLSSPVAISRSPGRIEVFGVGTNYELFVIEYRDHEWGNWITLGGVVSGPPNAYSWSPNRLEIFSTGSTCIENGPSIQKDMICRLSRSFSGEEWIDWVIWDNNTDHEMVGRIGLTSRHVGSYEVFARSSKDLKIYHRSWTQHDGRSEWREVDDTQFRSGPGAVSLNPGTVDLFAVERDGTLMQNRWFFAEDRWTGWSPIPGVVGAHAPAVVSMRANEIEVFIRGADGDYASTTTFHHITVRKH